MVILRKDKSETLGGLLFDSANNIAPAKKQKNADTKHYNSSIHKARLEIYDMFLKNEEIQVYIMRDEYDNAKNLFITLLKQKKNTLSKEIGENAIDINAYDMEIMRLTVKIINDIDFYFEDLLKDERELLILEQSLENLFNEDIKHDIKNDKVQQAHTNFKKTLSQYQQTKHFNQDICKYMISYDKNSKSYFDSKVKVLAEADATRVLFHSIKNKNILKHFEELQSLNRFSPELQSAIKSILGSDKFYEEFKKLGKSAIKVALDDDKNGHISSEERHNTDAYEMYFRKAINKFIENKNAFNKWINQNDPNYGLYEDTVLHEISSDFFT